MMPAVDDQKLSHWFERDDVWQEQLRIALKQNPATLRNIVEDMIIYGPLGPVTLGLKPNGSWNMGGYCVGETD